jgi:hypothetical protein
MSSLEHALVGFFGTMIVLAWAMHEIVHHHEVAHGVV